MADKKIKKTTEEKDVKVAKTTKAKTTKAVQEEIASETVVAEKKPTEKKQKSTLTVSVYDVAGKEIETLSLPEAIFGAKVNKVLMAQAVRVYLANQRQGNASTKTRGEVRGSTRKIYRQKGTGRARHGGVRAPIFVKGGIAHGPKPQDHSLSMPKKMKKAALFSALSAQVASGSIKVIAGLEALEPKTKIMAQALNQFGLAEKKAKILLVMPGNTQNVTQAGRNLVGVTITASDRLNTYDVLNAKRIVFMKDAIKKVEEVFGTRSTSSGQAK